MLEQFVANRKKWVRPALILGPIFFLMLLLWSSVGANLNRIPADPILFFEMYIKEIFPFFLLGNIVWFVMLRRYLPSRNEEFKFLRSLPVRKRHLSFHFFLQEWSRFVWMPLVCFILLVGFYQLAPIAHIFRLSILLLLLYTSLLALMKIAEFWLALRKSDMAEPLARTHSGVALGLVVLWAFGQVALILSPALVSGLIFWALSLFFFLLMVLLAVLYQHLFLSWCDLNLVHRSGTHKTASHSRLFNYAQFRLHPLLYRYALKQHRQKRFFSTLLTGIFIFLAYLAALNNQRLDDFLSVLFAIFIFYALVFSFRSIRQLSPDEESERLLYALPIKKSMLYFSFWLPSALFLSLMSLLFSALAWSHGLPLLNVAIFLAKLEVSAVLLFSVALNSAVTHYPQIKKAETRFFYWLLALVILSALFYAFRYEVFLLLVSLTFFPLIRVKLFRTQFTGINK